MGRFRRPAGGARARGLAAFAVVGAACLFGLLLACGRSSERSAARSSLQPRPITKSVASTPASSRLYIANFGWMNSSL